MPHEILTADILASLATDGEVRCTLGDATTEFGFATESAIYSGPLVYRPNIPDSNGEAAQALYLQDGDDAQILATKDVRYAHKVGTLDEGDWGLITDSEARVFCKKERDALVLYTADAQGVGLLLDISGVEGEIKIINGRGSFLTMTGDSISMAVDGGGSLTIDKDGVRVTGGSFQAVTGSVQLGDLGGGLPAPQSGGVLWGPSPGTIPSAKVFVVP